MNILSLFDGISCGRVALDRAGIKVDKYYASEIDENAIKISKKNYPDIIHIGDVNNINFNDYIGKIDLLMGGSPCTFWSIAKRNREVDKNGIGWKLFSKYIEALKILKPKYFIYENVNSMPETIKNFISEEFNCKPIMINSALVSAQQRKRLYWTNIPNINQPKDKKIILNDILESGIIDKDKSYALTASYNGTVIWNTHKHKQRTMIFKPIRLGHLNKGGQGDRIYSINGKSICISANGGGRGAKTGLYKIDLPDGDYTVRKLTPIECERLQTLPDNYTEGILKTQRYKCIGNGWTVDVIVHILKNIK